MFLKLRENSKSVFGVILVRIFPHSDQNNSEYEIFLRSDKNIIFEGLLNFSLQIFCFLNFVEFLVP